MVITIIALSKTQTKKMLRRLIVIRKGVLLLLDWGNIRVARAIMKIPQVLTQGNVVSGEVQKGLGHDSFN